MRNVMMPALTNETRKRVAMESLRRVGSSVTQGRTAATTTSTKNTYMTICPSINA